jgi:hypothetical protein
MTERRGIDRHVGMVFLVSVVTFSVIALFVDRIVAGLWVIASAVEPATS